MKYTSQGSVRHYLAYRPATWFLQLIVWFLFPCCYLNRRLDTLWRLNNGSYNPCPVYVKPHHNRFLGVFSRYLFGCCCSSGYKRRGKRTGAGNRFLMKNNGEFVQPLTPWLQECRWIENMSFFETLGKGKVTPYGVYGAFPKQRLGQCWDKSWCDPLLRRYRSC